MPKSTTSTNTTQSTSIRTDETLEAQKMLCSEECKKSLLPKLTAQQWVHTIAGALCFTFSYGFLRAWPNLFQPIQSYLNGYGNVTELIDDGNGNNITNPNFVQTAQLSTTSACMLNGLQIAAAFCGLILPKLGNRLATMIAGSVAICGYMIMPIAIKNQYWTFLYVLCMICVGIPMGIVNSSAQNNIKNNVPGSGRGFATTFAVAGNTVGHFCLPIIFDIYVNNFDISLALRLAGLLFVFLIIAGFMMKPAATTNPADLPADADSAEDAIDEDLEKSDDKCTRLAKDMIKATKEKPQIFSKKLWLDNAAYNWYAIHFVLALGAYFASLTFLPIWIEKQETNLPEGSPEIRNVRLLSQQFLAIAEAVGRFIGLCIVEKINKSKILGPTYATLAVGWTVFCYGIPIGNAIGVNGVYVFYGSMVIVGVATGTFGGTFFAQAMDVIPRQKHAVGMSMLNLLSGERIFWIKWSL